MTTELTLNELRTAPVREVSEALSFKSPRQFLKAWGSAGYRTLRPSPNKHVVFVSDVARFLSDRLVPVTQTTEHHV